MSPQRTVGQDATSNKLNKPNRQEIENGKIRQWSAILRIYDRLINATDTPSHATGKGPI